MSSRRSYYTQPLPNTNVVRSGGLSMEEFHERATDRLKTAGGTVEGLTEDRLCQAFTERKQQGIAAPDDIVIAQFVQRSGIPHDRIKQIVSGIYT